MNPLRIAVDVHGGDYGADFVIQGVLEAAKKLQNNIIFYLCGEPLVIEKNIRNNNNQDLIERGVLSLIPCAHYPGTEKLPSRVWKNHRNSSIIRCIELQSEGKVDATLSAGDTRILIGASIFILGRCEGITRPALAAFLPTTGTKQTLVLDVGANLDCKTDHLITFGIMGGEYVKKIFSREKQSIYLLNVGHEESKGTKTICDTHQELKNILPCYKGFIEGNSVLTGQADVIICDGFIGNILLKTCESFHMLVESVLKNENNLIDILRSKMTILNAENYGAVPLLGIKGTVFKAHGSSSPRAIAHAIATAIKFCHQQAYIAE